jgi:hypothetical protein
MSIMFMRPTFLTIGFIFLCFVAHSADSLFTFHAGTPSVSTNLFDGPNYSLQLPKSCPDTNYWLKTAVPNERTGYSMRIFKPCPGTNYCLQIIKPNEGTNYVLQIIHK